MSALSSWRARHEPRTKCGDVPRIMWATGDGRVAFLMVGSRVERVEYCSGVVKRRLVQEGVGGVSLGQSGIAFSLQATPRVLRFQPESEATSSTAVELPCPIGELWAGFANEAVFVRCRGKHSLFLVVEAGHVEVVPGPNEGEIVDLLPILGTGEKKRRSNSGLEGRADRHSEDGDRSLEPQDETLAEALEQRQDVPTPSCPQQQPGVESSPLRSAVRGGVADVRGHVRRPPDSVALACVARGGHG